MRVIPLLTGLVGLIAVALAAPTSEDSSSSATVFDVTTDTATETITSALPDFGKIRVCNGRRGAGTCVEVDPLKGCRQLPKPVRFNVQSLIQSKGLWCAYTTGESCDKSAFGVNSIKNTVAPDVSPKWSRLLTGVVCLPGSSTAVIDDLADAPALSDPSLQARTKVMSSDTAFEDTSDASLELGKVRICNGRRGQGHCVDVNAHMKCVQLSAPIRFNVQSLVQSQGNLCSYSQGKSCDNSAFTVDSSKRSVAPDVDMKWSPVITGVLCIPGPGAAKSEAVTAETKSITTASSIDPGKVRICNGRSGQGHCVDVNANFKCVQLSAPIRFNVQSLVQSKGNFCSYSQGKNCDNFAFVVDSSKSEQSTDVTKWSRVITGVQCISGPSTAITDDVAASNTDNNSLQVRNEAAPNFHVRLYNDLDSKGDCLDISVEQPCFPLPQKWRMKVKSFSISPNVLCRFWKGTACVHENQNFLYGIHSLHAPHDWTANFPARWSRRETLVSCHYRDHAAAALGSDMLSYSPEEEALPHPIEQRDTATATASLAGEALLCSGPLPAGPCFKALANGQCTDLPPPVDRNVREIHQKRGSVCEYFSSDNCAGRLGGSETPSGDIWVPVPAQIVHRIASVNCRARAMGMSELGMAGKVGEVDGEFVLDEAEREE